VKIRKDSFLQVWLHLLAQFTNSRSKILF
jgi:hypothetical protein